MKFYNEKGPLYLETDTSGIQLGTGLLQARDGLQFPQDKVPDNSALLLTAFVRKSLKGTETKV